MKRLILFATLLFPCSCKVQKNLALMDGSKADGTLTFVYEYHGFQKPIVNWVDAQATALRKCQSWGYKGAEFFGNGMSDCTAYNQYGCVAWRVTYRCQCTDK